VKLYIAFSFLLTGAAWFDGPIAYSQELGSPLSPVARSVLSFEPDNGSSERANSTSSTPDTIPSRYPYIIVRPEDRAWLSGLPVEMRPNRPLHFYGNTVRRLEQSGWSNRLNGSRR